MAGLVPAIHVLAEKKKDVDARHTARHDAAKARSLITILPFVAASL